MRNPRRQLFPLLLCCTTVLFSMATYAHEDSNKPQYGNPWTIDPASIPATASGKLPKQPEQLPQWSSECPAPPANYPGSSGYPATSGGYPPPGYGSGVNPGRSTPYPPNASYAYPYQGGWQQQQPGYGYYSPYNTGSYGTGYPGMGYPGTGLPLWTPQPYGLGGLPGVGSGWAPGTGNLFGFPSFW